MMRVILFLVCAVTMIMGDAAPVAAQTTRDSIVTTVQRFFDAMSTRDVATTRALLVADGHYHRVNADNAAAAIQRVTFDDYLARLATTDVTLLERMWQPTVLHHGPIAVLWTAYDFHQDGVFSHCGVDAFHLIRSDAGWKIASIVFTVERNACPESPLGPVGHQP